MLSIITDVHKRCRYTTNLEQRRIYNNITSEDLSRSCSSCIFCKVLLLVPSYKSILLNKQNDTPKINFKQCKSTMDKEKFPVQSAECIPIDFLSGANQHTTNQIQRLN
ncbi:hypothetical protein T03_3093 [Trichinella britovi]|uniref:Uncharacterized protein n=1 Tax=Trichinella britovi TaxID=45882 RepID=A0A0V1CAP8_TRIBR|nr:hypothetical protein T03_3093 [Trichinella britovi]